jgi:hypothetical protein
MKTSVFPTALLKYSWISSSNPENTSEFQIQANKFETLRKLPSKAIYDVTSCEKFRGELWESRQRITEHMLFLVSEFAEKISSH